MRLLIDECVEGPVARALAPAGHDVLWVSQECPGATDMEVAALAAATGRIVLTEDYDFGELAVRRGAAVTGVVLLACTALSPADRPARVLQVLREDAGSFEEHFTVIDAERVRRRRLS